MRFLQQFGRVTGWESRSLLREYIFVGILGTLALTACLAFPAWAASFDCGKASFPMETAICNDQGLSVMDEQLAAAYTAAIAKSSDKGVQLKIAQRLWIQEARKCESDGLCIAAMYIQRIADLSAVDTYQPATEHVVKDAVPARLNASASESFPSMTEGRSEVPTGALLAAKSFQPEPTALQTGKTNGRQEAAPATPTTHRASDFLFLAIGVAVSLVVVALAQLMPVRVVSSSENSA